MKIFKSKQFFLFYIAVVAVGVMALYINNNLIRSQADVAKVTVQFSAPSGPVTVNQESEASILVTPDGGDQNKVSFFDLRVVASGNVKVVRFGTPIMLPSGQPFANDALFNTNTRVAYAKTGEDAQLPHVVKIPVIVMGTAEGAGSLNIDSSGTAEITGNVPERAYTLNSVSPLELTVTAGGPTCPAGQGQQCCTSEPKCNSGLVCSDSNVCEPVTPSGDVKLLLKVRFQGILTKPKSSDKMTVRVKLSSGPLSDDTGYQTAEFVSDESGIYSGTVSFAVAEGDGYRVMVRGQKHLQKRVCDQKPTETQQGTYNCVKGVISLHKGDNNLDFSGIRLVAGDIAVQGTELASQDNRVDENDTAFLRQSLNKTDEKTLQIADFNMDGILDTQDYSLVLANLRLKLGDE